jgi:two-component system cell cycle response regulator CpdR
VILLVEDEGIPRYAFAKLLRFHSHEVMEARDGVEALTLLDKYAFDLIITDLVMPRLDGFALIAQVRETSPNLPIVLISGYTADYAAAASRERRNFFRSRLIHLS